jgi:hypothetical protein
MVDHPKENPHDLIMASLPGIAVQILEVPKSEREGLYTDFGIGFRKQAAAAGLDPKPAEEFGQKYLEFLRALVRIIESGGGASGGHA